MLARDFFAVVAKDRPAFTALAAIVSSDDPTRSYGRHLVCLGGNLIVSAGVIEPKVFEAHA